MNRDEVIKNLRSCLISCKGGIKLERLREDYRLVTGDNLPYKQCGYPSVETFVRSIPDISVVKRSGELFVEAVPSKTSVHLTKLVSRQKSTRRKIRPQPKKWTPPRHAKGFSSGFRSNDFNTGFQPARNNYVSSSNSFTKSTPGKSNLYTDFTRPVPLMETVVQCLTKSTPGKSNLYTDFTRPVPLMETVVQCPLPYNDSKPSFAPIAPPASPTKRLKNKVTNPNVAIGYQSVDNCKTMKDLRCKVLNDNTALSVINERPKTVELRPPKLSDRLKVFSETPRPLISNNNNNAYIPAPIPSIFAIPQVAAPFEASDPRKELEIRANLLQLSSPIYKMYSKKEKNSTKTTIYASVKVGLHTFHTFPEDAASEEEAERIAARLALVNLAKESLSYEVTTADTELIKKRILNIVTQHQSGVFMHSLPESYNKQYGETLPNNWKEIIEDCTDINQEKGVGQSTILCLTPPISKQSESNSPSRNISENILPLNKKIQLNPIGPTTPNVLSVPESPIWQVYVTYVVSTVEIWVRLGDKNNEFVDMTSEMTKYYDKVKKPVSPGTCVYGDFYAVLEENYWHRVQCIDFNNKTGLATVFFIDEGYEEQYKPDVLHPLDKQFCILPCQAIRIGLQGLKEFRDCDQIVTEIENYLLVDQLFYVRVHDMDNDEYGSYVMVTFYDTNKGDDDVDVNQALFDKILNDMAAAFLMHVGQIIELYVTHIEESGKVYAQINSLAKTVLDDTNIMQMCTNNTVDKINFTKMYLVKINSLWYRARVSNIPTEQEVIVSLIDVGRTVLIQRENLFSIDRVSKALQYIPPQATQIFLHSVDSEKFNKRLVARFRELVSETDMLLAKVIRITQYGIPVVEIFKRESSNMLMSINNTLVYEELSKVNEDNNNNKSKKRSDRKNSRAPEFVSKLNPPVISDIGDYFDVHVTLVAHPGHFIVQPFNNLEELNKMMLDLRSWYSSNYGPPLESVSEGKLYAGQYQDDWYRVYVTDIISDNEVSVYFCDYGDVTIVSRSSLQPLNSKFLKLAYQAIKAKLVGIEPMNVDWTVTDCVKFKDLVRDKNFVSIIEESVFDDLSPVNGTMLGLRLIDVSTDNDIYIDKLLVEEKRAKYTKEFEGLP